MDSQPFQFQQIVLVAASWIIGKERISDSQARERVKETVRIGEQRGSHVDGSVHVERHMLDACAGLEQLQLAHGRHVFIKFFHFNEVSMLIHVWERD